MNSPAHDAGEDCPMRADITPAVAPTPNETTGIRVSRLGNKWIAATAAFLIASAVVLADRPFTHTETGDSSIFDYIAQSIVRGQVPYRDVIDPKGPGSMYVSAAAMALGRSAGMRDIIAVRWLHVVLMGLLAAITFLVAEEYFENRVAAVLAALIPFVTGAFSSQVIRGTQPKLPMALFGMVSLLLVAKRRPFWAGFFSMLSCLCWQPGLMFTGVAVLIFSKYLTSWRDRSALKTLLGAAVPLAVVLVYFACVGALGELWSWTVVYPSTVFAPETSMSLAETVDTMWAVVERELKPASLIVPSALAGLVIYIAARIEPAARLRSRELFKDAIVYPPVIYLIFCAINFQSAPDLIPFYPFIGLFAAWLVVELSRLVSQARPKLAMILPACAMLIVAVLLVLEHGPGGRESTLQDQDREAQIVASYLGPDERIYEHGMGEVLVLLNKPNAARYLALNSGADNFIAARKPGGFRDIVDELESAAPRVVVMTRLRNVRHAEELRDWVEQHYDKLELAHLKGVHIRRQ